MLHVIISLLVLGVSAGVYLFVVSTFSPVMTLIVGLAVTCLILVLSRENESAPKQRPKYRKYHNLF